MSSVLVLAVLFGIVAFGSCLQRVSGMGLGLIAGPVLSLLLGPVHGILVVNLLTLVNAALITIAVRRLVDWGKFAPIGATLVFGSVPAALLIRVVSPAILQVLVGGALVVGLAVITLAPSRVPTPHGKGPVITAGVVGGFMNTLAGVAGPAVTVYAKAAGWEQRIYAATLQPIFVVAGLISLIIKLLTGAGTLGGTNPLTWVVGIAGMALGIAMGKRIGRRIPQPVAHRLALALAALGGISVLIRGLAGTLLG